MDVEKVFQFFIHFFLVAEILLANLTKLSNYRHFVALQKKTCSTFVSNEKRANVCIVWKIFSCHNRNRLRFNRFASNFFIFRSRRSSFRNRFQSTRIIGLGKVLASEHFQRKKPAPPRRSSLVTNDSYVGFGVCFYSRFTVGLRFAYSSSIWRILALLLLLVAH